MATPRERLSTTITMVSESMVLGLPTLFSRPVEERGGAIVMKYDERSGFLLADGGDEALVLAVHDLDIPEDEFFDMPCGLFVGAHILVEFDMHFKALVSSLLHVGVHDEAPRRKAVSRAFFERAAHMLGIDLETIERGNHLVAAVDRHEREMPTALDLFPLAFPFEKRYTLLGKHTCDVFVTEDIPSVADIVADKRYAASCREDDLRIGELLDVAHGGVILRQGRHAQVAPEEAGVERLVSGDGPTDRDGKWGLVRHDERVGGTINIEGPEDVLGDTRHAMHLVAPVFAERFGGEEKAHREVLPTNALACAGIDDILDERRIPRKYHLVVEAAQTFHCTDDMF